MIKVKPKTFDFPTGKTTEIVGINAKFINEFPVSITPVKSYIFYIEFITSKGEKRDPINVSSQEFYDFLITKGFFDEEVKTMLSQTFEALLIGSKEQCYQALTGIFGFYGYELLPIEEQEGHFESIL